MRETSPASARWVEAGYIVVVPTLRKRWIPGGVYWEFPRRGDPFPRLVTDTIRAMVTDPEEYFVDRFRDVKFVCDNLDEILNSKVNGCYSTTESEIGIAGHSWGTPVVQLAAGATIDRPRAGQTDVTIDLTEHGFSRIESGPSPYIDAAAFLLISAGQDMKETDSTVFDRSDPAFFGKDYVQRPLLAAIGGNDLITDDNGYFPWMTGLFTAATTDWFPSISKAVGLNHAPAYGVVIDGANHVTPVSQFHYMPSWDFDFVWDWVATVVEFIDGLNTKVNLEPEDRTSDEDDLLSDNLVADAVVDVFKGMFPSAPETTDEAEDNRMLRYGVYSISFWDTYLSGQSH